MVVRFIVKNMKKVLWLVITILSLHAFLGCNSKSNSDIELQKTYYKSGKLHEVIPLVNGIVQGVKKEFYEDGALRLEVPYDSGYVNGNVKYYYQNGKLYSLTPRRKGLIHGVVKKYYSTGSLQSETPYYDNKLQPGLKEYDKQGNLIINPEIVCKTNKSRRGKDLQVTVEVSLSRFAKNIAYFQAVHYEGKDTTFSRIPSENGVGRLSVILTKGSSIDQEILIKSEYLTQLNNRGVTQKKYRFFAKN